MGLLDNFWTKSKNLIASLQTRNAELELEVAALQNWLGESMERDAQDLTHGRAAAIDFVPTQPAAFDDETLVQLPANSIEIGQPSDQITDAELLSKLDVLTSGRDHSDRLAGGMKLANTLRRLLTNRLLLDLHDSKVEIVRLCDLDISASLDASLGEIDARTKRLDERESLVLRNFAELQRRENALAERIKYEVVNEHRALIDELHRLRSAKSSAQGNILRKEAEVKQIREEREKLIVENKRLKDREGLAAWELETNRQRWESEIEALKDEGYLKHALGISSLKDGLAMAIRESNGQKQQLIDASKAKAQLDATELRLQHALESKKALKSDLDKAQKAKVQYVAPRSSDRPWREATDAGDFNGAVSTIDTSEFVSESPLHLFGYNVVVSSQHSIRERRDLLVAFYGARTISFAEPCSAEYRSHWGKPTSVQRLYRMAIHIKWLIDRQGRDHRKGQANDDWRSDLKWLEQTYYKPAAHRFKWPEA